MDRRKNGSLARWAGLTLCCWLLLLLIIMSPWEDGRIRGRSLEEQSGIGKNVCNNIIPFYLNSHNFFNPLREINVSNNFSLRWNINYIYFEYFNDEFFINFNLHSLLVKDVKLYEYRDRSVLLLEKDASHDEVKFFIRVEPDKSVHPGDMRTFYFVIHSGISSNFSSCVNVMLELNVGLVSRYEWASPIYGTAINQLTSGGNTNEVRSLHSDRNIVEEKKSKLPAHHKDYIIVKENYYYASSEDYYVRFERKKEELYANLQGNEEVIVYTVLLFTQFTEHGSISFYSHLTEDITKEKNFHMHLKKLTFGKSYLYNMSVHNILRLAYLDNDCTKGCVHSVRTKNGLLLHALLENNSVYKFEVKYTLGRNSPDWLAKNSDGAHFNVEFSIVRNAAEYTMVDFIREHFTRECMHNTFFPSAIIQGEGKNVAQEYSHKGCKEGQKESCTSSDQVDEFIIYGRMIELNDNFIFNFDPINFFVQNKQISVIISEDSLFNLVVTSKIDNVYINLLKKDLSHGEKVCNTYYLNNLNDYTLFNYMSKEMDHFPHGHVNKAFADDYRDDEEVRRKKFSQHNMAYINCALSKGEYFLRISVDGHNMVCDSNEVSLTIHPVGLYEERHKCDSSMNVVTDLFYYHLRSESKKHREEFSNLISAPQGEGLTNEEGSNSIAGEIKWPKKIEEDGKKRTYQNIYENRWILNNPIFQDFDFVILYERHITERVDELLVTINNSIFVDLFFVIVEPIREQNSYYYIYRNSRNVFKYKIKHGDRPFTIYLLASTVHYPGKQLCGFFFIDIDLVTRKKLTIEEKGPDNAEPTSNAHNMISRINYIPDLIIGYDSYSFSNFCYIPKFKKHSLIIYIKENSIVKINCFSANYVYICLYDQNRRKLYDGYNQLYIESFTKGEYEIVLQFNASNDQKDNAFFYLQFYVFHLSLLDRCAHSAAFITGADTGTDRGIGIVSQMRGESTSIGSEGAATPPVATTPNVQDMYDLTPYVEANRADFTMGANQTQVKDKNTFFFQSSNVYYLFKRDLLLLHPNKRIVKELILPHVTSMDSTVTFLLKIELIFAMNYLPYKLAIQDMSNTRLQYHDSYTYKNKILMTLPLVNSPPLVENRATGEAGQVGKRFKLYVDLYEEVNENLRDNFCTYAYLHIMYTSEMEAFQKWDEQGISYSTVNLPLLLNNILFKGSPGATGKAFSVGEGSNHGGDHSAMISLRNSDLPIANQSVQYTFELLNNNVFLFLVRDNLFFDMYMYRENRDIKLNVYKFSDTEKLLSGGGITYDEVMKKGSSSIGEEIASLNKGQIYLSMYLTRGLYIFVYERGSGPFFANLSVVWHYKEGIPSGSYLTGEEGVGLPKEEVGVILPMGTTPIRRDDAFLREEISFLFGKEVKCNEGTKVHHGGKKLHNLSYFWQEIIKNENFEILENSTTTVEIKKGEQSNALIYKRFYICLSDQVQKISQEGRNSNDSTHKSSETIDKNYTLFNLNIEESAQVYVEINPHYHFFVYPFNLNIVSKRSFFDISSGHKTFITIELYKGEYEIHLAFPGLEREQVKDIIFDLVILIVSSRSGKNETNQRNTLTYIGNSPGLSPQSDVCKAYPYKPLFNKVNLVDIGENDVSVKKNIISSKYKNQYFHLFGKFFLKNYKEEVFFTIPNGYYFLKIFCVPIDESTEENISVEEGEEKNEIREVRKISVGNFSDPSMNFVNSFLNVRNVFNIRVVQEHSGEANEDGDDKKDSSQNSSLSVSPIFANEDEEFMLNLYQVEKNFKVVIRTNSYFCNYFQLVVSLYPLDFYNSVQSYMYSQVNSVEKYMKNIFDTLSVKAKLYEDIKFEQEKFPSHQYVRIETDVVNLRSVQKEDSFSLPVVVHKGSYFKVNLGYDFSLANFQMKLAKNGVAISSSTKMEVNLKDNSLNTFENISLYLEEGNYTLEIHSYHITANLNNINKNFSFFFYFELEIFEFSDDKTGDAILLDVFPHNSMAIDRSYPFGVDIIFWGRVHAKDIHLQDDQKTHIEPTNRTAIKYANIEVQKFVLSPEIMNKMERNFIFKISPNCNIYVNQEKEKRLKFTLSTEDKNASIGESVYGEEKGEAITTNERNEENGEVHPESVNNSFLLRYAEKEIPTDIRGTSYVEGTSQKDSVYDIDRVIQNFRLNEMKRREEEDSTMGNPSKEETEACIPLTILTIEFSCFEKGYFLIFIFFLCFCFMMWVFLFVVLKLYKNWKYYRNYDVITESDEVVNLFDDDHI
ncbi:conserved Plasmodium protein, unknown function [Plasmodium knowlesi strain H]|uniref:Uncharacterized protein n=3 Tax=Plasmodium knowlesi TaxID=5850 RepID=A0A5K1VSP6_PLAKH|nr:conserved Plasmodium protein, unknown function [Plasmodium knowlesi strain H]OTN67971.1 Uncharacterized protein PKNOH_S04364700 [Plasmodium knowlesi]CAA9987007.1 conserved Plasmodium protein, unknown function [Plasmodium knowlesi strain H]SBO26667.1 conserved Plasmodium protein, unknown function [Plasmodium knowlesi strain H]SBO28212.1 conserved Plasmodium protein, unknown function [Plasmodium knowlesi strain H]VVS76481.1 conserved Plasmodium protein, unknown function [Plasmodium knowlesi s|eukprot:XP_002258252.1 hypothetical protein, conserved in Plasmodium species [Plasmodium knowlesi strain H]